MVISFVKTTRTTRIIPQATRSSPKVRSAVFRRVAELAAWSMKWAARGVWPDTGFEGVPFATTTERSKKCGDLLAHGWKTLVEFLE